jgi:hypothetical protein
MCGETKESHSSGSGYDVDSYSPIGQSRSGQSL